METIEESIKANKPESKSFEKSSKISSLTPRNILGAIGSRFFNSGQDEKILVTHCGFDKGNLRERLGEIRIPERCVDRATTKIGKKYVLHTGAKEVQQRQDKPIDRDLRRFKAKYNSSMGNIVREWMSLIYCILILRMNLIKYILSNLPERSESDTNLHYQILLESKTVFSMIRNAQQSSQDKFLHLWLQLEKLIFNRKVLRNALQLLQFKETGYRDWKAADSKLAESQMEFEKASQEYKDAQKGKEELEIKAKDTLSQLDKLVFSKEAEYNTLLEKVTEMKKREVQMRGKILINMKSYKDLKAKKEKLINVEEKMDKLKREQKALVEEYSSKIKSLKNEIEEKERQIKEEKEEKRRIRSSLEGLGDCSEKYSFQ